MQEFKPTLKGILQKVRTPGVYRRSLLWDRVGVRCWRQMRHEERFREEQADWRGRAFQRGTLRGRCEGGQESRLCGVAEGDGGAEERLGEFCVFRQGFCIVRNHGRREREDNANSTLLCHSATTLRSQGYCYFRDLKQKKEY